MCTFSNNLYYRPRLTLTVPILKYRSIHNPKFSFDIDPQYGSRSLYYKQHICSRLHGLRNNDKRSLRRHYCIIFIYIHGKEQISLYTQLKIRKITDASTPEPGEIVFNTMKYRINETVKISGYFSYIEVQIMFISTENNILM